MILRIRDMRLGDSFAGVIVNRMAGVRSGSSGPYLDLRLFDGVNEISGRFWNYSGDAPPPNTVVYIEGQVTEYRGNLQLRLDFIRLAEKGEYGAQDFIASSPYNPEEMLANLKQLADGVQNPYLKKLLGLALFNNQVVKKYFCSLPGAKFHHHAYLCGLLEHTCNVVNMAVGMAQYSKAAVDLDLLVTGGILHDIGKIKEYTVDIVIEVTDACNFVGHIAAGYEYISSLIRSIEGFPCDLKYKLGNMLLSHHGPRENGHGSTVDPVTPEAYILHVCDKADTVLFKFDQARENAEEGQKWQRIWGAGAGKSDLYVGP